MKTKHVIGQRITGIEQSRWTDPTGKRVYDIEAIVLENGYRLRFLTIEMGEDECPYVIQGIVRKPYKDTP